MYGNGNTYGKGNASLTSRNVVESPADVNFCEVTRTFKLVNEFRDEREPSYVKDMEGMGNGLNSGNEVEGRTEC